MPDGTAKVRLHRLRARLRPTLPPGMKPVTRIDDPRYVNICVEQIDYTPVSYDWLIAKAWKAMA